MSDWLVRNLDGSGEPQLVSAGWLSETLERIDHNGGGYVYWTELSTVRFAEPGRISREARRLDGQR